MLAANPLDAIVAYKSIATVRFWVLLLLISITMAVTVLPIPVASLGATLVSFAFFMLFYMPFCSLSLMCSMYPLFRLM
ncbi:hypothetical protein HD806DRAFT_487517 [Xylariaceae sp. AK1471]|nr:hypothetical protein HD806DRAFT_487517 [Xylariaceae sp. AK1471]